ncbi:MAG: glycosyl transferase [Anaerolineae bacterium]|nr:glycosyl transferase [Anaerolineae bacterium]
MQFGTFDDVKREYVITNPNTPLPWINYLGCENYFGIISNTAGGYSFYRDARLRRLTRYRYNNVPLDFGGRYLYLRDNTNGKYWSPSWKPTCHEDQTDYTCRHGLGYTIIGSTYEGIAAETLYFVPLGENLEVWQVTLSNQRETAAELSLFSSIEFCLWDANDDATNFQRNYSIGEVEVLDGVIYHKTEYRERRDHYAYFACSEPLAGFDTQRDSFLGQNRSWERPLVVEQGESRNSVAYGWAPLGSHHVKLILQPGESRQVIFLLGYQENPKDQKFDPPHTQAINKRDALPVIAQYLNPDAVKEAFIALGRHWDALLSLYQAETPNLHTNRMVNLWNAYQTMVTFNLSRSASLFESGIGRGMGFRDSNQDLLAFVQMDPARSRERLIDLASTQFENGGAYHQYQPLTKRGNNDVGGGFNDDPHWLVLAVAAYLKETGDFAFLDTLVPFDNQPGSEQPMWEHLRRCISYTLDRLGPHQLPLIGRADWNDCMNLNIFSEEPGTSFQTAPLKMDGKTAESLFIAGLFVLSANEMAAMAEQQGLQAEANTYRAKAREMTTAVEASGWDGEWFLRAYDALGDVVGSHRNEEGKIFIEPQGMCVMGGIGLDNGKAEQALDSVRKYLAKPQGIVLQQPAFTHYYLNLGEIGSFLPGLKENASVFCHNNPWVMIAESCLGRGGHAFDYYMRTNPAAQETISEVRRCEPYVYAQMVAGPDAPCAGEAKNSWLTGAAAYHYVAITQWILGVRPAYAGLEIAPRVPEDWQQYSVTRKFRGSEYHIDVERVGQGNAVALTVDGSPVAGNIVPFAETAGSVVAVRVRLGEP